MKRTGELLKNERTKQGLSINDVAMATKIGTRILQAIEDGDPDKLPAKPFLRGFVRSYALHLKLDLNTVMDSFMEEMGSTLPEIKDVSPSEEESEIAVTPPVNRESNGPKFPFIKETSMTTKSLVVAGIVTLILIIIGVKNLVEKYERERQVDLASEPLATPPVEANGSEERQPTPTTRPPSPRVTSTTEDPPKAPVASSSSATSPEAESEPPTADTSNATQQTSASSEVTPPEPSVAATTPPPREAASRPSPQTPTRPQEVILEALDRVDVSFRINDGPPERITLQPDQVHTIKAEGRISLDFSDGGAINVIHNGRDRGVPGDLGRPKTMSLP